MRRPPMLADEIAGPGLVPAGCYFKRVARALQRADAARGKGDHELALYGQRRRRPGAFADRPLIPGSPRLRRQAVAETDARAPAAAADPAPPSHRDRYRSA